MKTRVFIMIALLIIAVGSVSGQFHSSYQGLDLYQSSNVGNCNLLIENNGSDDIQIAFLGLGSPNNSFPDIIMADICGNPLVIGEWYENNVCYFILDSIIEPGECIDFQLLSSNGDTLSFREISAFVRIGDYTSDERSMSTGDSLLLKSCCGGVTGIPVNSIPQGMVYPNPTSDYLNISYTEEIEKIIIIDQLGHPVLWTKISEIIDVSALPSGIYFVQIEFSSGAWVQKTILKH